MEKETFSSSLKSILEAQDVTASELSRMVGVTHQAVQSLIRKNNPTIDVAIRYLSNLGYDVAFVRRGKRLPEGSYVIGSSKEHE